MRNRDVGDAIENLVEVACRGALEPAITVAALARGKYDIETLAPFRDHRNDQFWRILQVGVDRDNCCAKRKVKARTEGDVFAEIARQTDHLDCRRAAMKLDQVVECR